MSPDARRRAPQLLLPLGAVALVTGLWAGLNRLGAAPPGPVAPISHGPLLVGGFLGTVIALERAVAARRAWTLSAPALCAAGGAAVALGWSSAGAALFCAGSAVLVVLQLQLLRGGVELHLALMGAASALWLAGNALLAAGWPIFDVVPFWLVFLIGTIAAERLELNRLLPRSRLARGVFLVGFALASAGPPLGLAWRDLGMRTLGAGALVLAAWLLRYDVARYTIRQPGAPRFMAWSLLTGNVWLGVGGGLALALGHPVAGPRYDALLHAVLVGFVFSMIFGHALVIVPALLGVRVPYRARFYAHLALLHLSLGLRLGADLAVIEPLRRASAWLNAAAVALFVVSTALAVLGAGRHRSQRRAGTSSAHAPADAKPHANASAPGG